MQSAGAFCLPKSYAANYQRRFCLCLCAGLSEHSRDRDGRYSWPVNGEKAAQRVEAGADANDP